MMELFVGLAGVILGLFGTIFSIFLAVREDKREKQRIEIEDKREKERIEIDDKREKERIEIDEKREKERLAIEEKREKQRNEENRRIARLDFLINVIIDEDIPRESRKIFYEEFVALGGNGTINKFWLRGEKAAR